MVGQNPTLFCWKIKIYLVPSHSQKSARSSDSRANKTKVNTFITFVLGVEDVMLTVSVMLTVFLSVQFRTWVESTVTIFE